MCRKHGIHNYRRTSIAGSGSYNIRCKTEYSAHLRGLLPRLSFVIIFILFVGFYIYGAFYSRVIYCKYNVSTDGPDSSGYIPKSSAVFDPDYAFTLIAEQLNFGPRVPLTAPHKNCADWIIRRLKPYCDNITVQNFNVDSDGDPYPISVTDGDEAIVNTSLRCMNILGKMNTDRKNILILAAHWDTRAVAEKDTVNRTSPIPGANDGASGVAVLLALAPLLYNISDKLNTQIWLLFLDAEDQGYSGGLYGISGWRWCEGAEVFASEIDMFYSEDKGEHINSFILLDMVGGYDLVFVKDTHSNNELFDKIAQTGRSLGYTSAFPEDPEDLSIIDDHVYFNAIGIPSVDLIIDFVNGPWPYHHTHGDNLEHIDKKSLNITGTTLYTFITKYYTSSTEPEWTYYNTDANIYAIYIIGTLAAGVILGLVLISFIRKRGRS